MTENTSKKLQQNIDRIMKRWVERADKEMHSANQQKTLPLKKLFA
jgi:hypothetical protein